MRLGVLSDLHFDINARELGCKPEELVDLTADVLSSAELDALVIAGDVADGWRASGRLQERLMARLDSRLADRTRILPGNHDLWRAGGSRESSWQAYRTLCSLPWALPSRPLELGQWSVVGETGWYRMAGRTSPFEPADWSDAPQDPHSWMLARLERQIREQKGRRLIVVTHYLPALECVAPQFAGSPANAFFVVPAIGELLKAQAPPVEAAVYGHTHVRQDLPVGGIPAFCCPLGYAWEWQGEDPEEEIRRALRVLDLSESLAVAPSAI